jgi:hypothetical protein
MQKFTQKQTMTIPNSQLPNSTFGTTKNPIMKQGISFSFHNFWTNRAKVIQYKAILIFRNLKKFDNDFFTN